MAIGDTLKTINGFSEIQQYYKPVEYSVKGVAQMEQVPNLRAATLVTF